MLSNLFNIFPNIRNAAKKHRRISSISTVLCKENVQQEATNAASSTTPLLTKQVPYTPEQCKRILHIINNKSATDLLSYEISKARLNKLQIWKRRNGALQNVEEMLLIEGFGLKFVEKFCRSLLNEESAVKKAAEKAMRPRTAPFITPSIDAELQQNIRSCLSLRIGVSSVSWARLELSNIEENSPCLLTHWKHHDITDKKMHLNDLVQRCLYLDHMLPAADCYLFENPQMAQVSNNPGNADQQNISIQKAQMTAVLSFALNARVRYNPPAEVEADSHIKEETEQKPLPQHVFYLRRFLTARLFQHLVGTERVSSEQTILHMMRTYYNVDQQQEFIHDEITDMVVSSDADANKSRSTFRGNVQFPAEFRHMFSHAERYHREFLGQALLLNLAFVRLILLQDANSIAAVSRNSKKTMDATES